MKKGQRQKTHRTGAVYIVGSSPWHSMPIGRREPHTPGERLSLGQWELISSKDKGQTHAVGHFGLTAS